VGFALSEDLQGLKPSEIAGLVGTTKIVAQKETTHSRFN
jgi:hypothetical protein